MQIGFQLLERERDAVQSSTQSRNEHLQERLTGVCVAAVHIMSNDSAKFHCLV